MPKPSTPTEAVGRLRSAFPEMSPDDQDKLIRLLDRYLPQRQWRQLVGLSRHHAWKRGNALT